MRSKLVLVGDPAVGKTALAQMFHSHGQRFPKNYLMTCGVEFSVKAVSLPDGETHVELHMFDTAGQDIFSDMLPQLYDGAMGIFLVYDVTRAHTLEACTIWYDRVLQAMGANKGSLPGVLVANKTDLRERAVVPRAQGVQIATQLGLQFFETSALEARDVDAPFAAAAALIKQAADA